LYNVRQPTEDDLSDAARELLNNMLPIWTTANHMPKIFPISRKTAFLAHFLL